MLSAGLDPHSAQGCTVAFDGRSVESGNFCSGDLGNGFAEEVRRPAPTGAEDERDVVRFDARVRVDGRGRGVRGGGRIA